MKKQSCEADVLVVPGRIWREVMGWVDISKTYCIHIWKLSTYHFKMLLKIKTRCGDPRDPSGDEIRKMSCICRTNIKNAK